jgi:hypothetical protein
MPHGIEVSGTEDKHAGHSLVPTAPPTVAPNMTPTAV